MIGLMNEPDAGTNRYITSLRWYVAKIQERMNTELDDSEFEWLKNPVLE